ncbi:MAG: hypothetical protein PHY47_15640 [Lachnospiraceae bacterium]|nr:hypothetical protein [Lachnospiraceae bacterium]
MKEKLLFMHKNVIQLSRMENCKIIVKSRYGFSAEIELRQGKYKIRIDYYYKGIVSVYMLAPNIDMSDSVEIHTYGMHFHGAYKKEIPELCLKHPKLDDWNPSILLIDSYIPWAAEWTEFYEIWLLTGVWYGGGVHPSSGPKKENVNEEKDR